MKPKLHIVKDYSGLSLEAAGRVASAVRKKPDAVISLPTGSTPVGMFKAMIGMARGGEVSFARTRVFCLDEYINVGEEEPGSLTGWLHANLFHDAGFARANIFTLPSASKDLQAGAKDYEAAIRKAGGMDLVVLGLGGNGHVAYNEPGSQGDSRTRVLTLTRESIEGARASFQGRVVPEQAMTVGVATLLEAREIVLIVSGQSKADVLHKALRGPKTPDIPASFLQFAGERLTVIADEAAARLL